jgi:acylaminoacyl-peptidase
MYRIATLCLSIAVAFFAVAQTPFTYEDMIRLDRISGLAVDPSGTKALFSLRATDLENNKGVSSLWLKDLTKLDVPEVKVAVGADGAWDVQWAQDGSGFYFLSARGGSTQVWKADAQGSSAKQITDLVLDVETYRVAPDGSGLAVALSVFPDCDGNAIVCTADRMKARAAEKSSGVLYDKLFIRHWDTWKDGTRSHLYYLPLPDATASPVALMAGFDGDVPSKPFGGNDDFAFSADGRSVFFSARAAGTKEPWSTNFDIYQVSITGGTPQNLTSENKAWDAEPVLSKDGKFLAYKAMNRPGFEADRFELKVRELATGKITTVAADWDRSAAHIKWSADGKSLFVSADDLGRHRLFRIDLKSGKVTQLSKEGSINAWHETPKGIVFQRSGLHGPPQLFAAKPKAAFIDEGATVLTQVNANMKDKRFGTFEQFSFSGWNNETVYGYLVKPSNYEEGKKYPVAFLIHGGPQGSFGDGWSYRWNPQTYAGEGYAVVMIDFHGSTGYGQGFTDAITEHWGDRPLEDLQKGLAHALKQYPFLDGDRVAALGASYGGYMVNWIAGVWPGAFKALVSHCGIFDTRAMGYSTEEFWFTDWENGTDVFSDPSAYDTFNPMLHVDNWRVPMLVIHGDLDYRVPLTQGIGSFSACQAKDIPSKYLRFPDENHWVLKPQNSMLWHSTVFEWLEQHLGGGR